MGITQEPVAFLMAQSLWHSLPIWVTSTTVSPIRSRVPTGRVFSSTPRVLMFSAKAPAFSWGRRARI